jgi:hypothetical protein
MIACRVFSIGLDVSNYGVDPFMGRALIFSILITGITLLPARAQAVAVDQFALARIHMQKGEACFNAGDMDCARREFDRAVDSILELGIDVRPSCSGPGER